MTLPFPQHFAHSACKGTGSVACPGCFDCATPYRASVPRCGGTAKQPCPEPNCFHGIDLDLVREGDNAARLAELKHRYLRLALLAGVSGATTPDAIEEAVRQTVKTITTLQDRVRELEGERDEAKREEEDNEKRWRRAERETAHVTAELKKTERLLELSQANDGGFAATIISGKLVMAEFGEFQRRAEELLGRPIMTHEFGNRETWDDLRQALSET